MVAAYLSEASLEEVSNDGDFIFKYDYVVVNVVNHKEYGDKYRAGSALWGGFTHIEEQSEKNTPFETPITLIRAEQGLRIQSDMQIDILWRAIDQTSPLERYLKLYHLLELNFDLEIIKELRALGDDLKGVGKLLQSYSGDKEFDRLLKVIRKHCPDQSFVVQILAEIFHNSDYHNQLFDILFEYSKESNPYKEKSDEFKTALSNGFSETEFLARKLTWKYDHLSRLVAYIIYRVRSSIAHSKIGEYLLTAADEKFVAEAAEPLLHSVLLKVHQ